MLWSFGRARADIKASSDTCAAEASDRATMPAQDLFEHDKQVEKRIGAAQGGGIEGGWRRRRKGQRGNGGISEKKESFRMISERGGVNPNPGRQ